MVQQPRLSVIVPAYNVADYVEQCLDSLLNQTYENLEIIVINDGSTDGTGEICRRYADHEKVIFIDQVNHGLPYCHELGLATATGTLITFMDSDDYLDLEMYREVTNAMTTYHADIGVTGVYLTDEAGTVLGEKFTGTAWTASRSKAMRELLLEHRLDSVITNKVFRRHVLAGLHFPASGFHDDIAFCYRAIHQSHRVVHTGTPRYYYRQREDSISRLPICDAKMSLLKFSEEIYHFAAKNYPELQDEAASLHYRTIKNTRAILAMYGAEDEAAGKAVKQQFDAIVPAALRNRSFRMRDRLTILALKTHSYVPLKKIAKMRS